MDALRAVVRQKERSSQREWFASSLVLSFSLSNRLWPTYFLILLLNHSSPHVSDRNFIPRLSLPPHHKSPTRKRSLCLFPEESVFDPRSNEATVRLIQLVLDSSPWVRVFIFNSHIDRLHLWQTKSCIDFAWVAVRCRLEKYGSLRIK